MSWIFFAALSAVAAAATVLCGIVATKYMDSAAMNTIKATFILLTSFGISFYNGPMSLDTIGGALKSKGLYFAILTGVFGSLSWIAYYSAITVGRETHTGTAARVAAINATYIILLAAAEPLLQLGAPVTPTQGLGILLVLGGTVLVILSR